MKTIYKIATLCLLLIAAAGCDKKDSTFSVGGDCLIESLVMDDIYTGVVDHAARTVVVGVPEVHDDREMTITALTLSAGATSDLKQGDKVNMTQHRLHHLHGDCQGERQPRSALPRFG